MASAISIPSPSVFLRTSPPPPAQSAPPTTAKHARPAEAKKKAPRKPTSSTAAPGGGAEGNGVMKPKQSKSRNGCVTCKNKRLKCGEEKPGCQQCAKRNVECGGYKKDFKWRPFEEQNVKVNMDKQQPKRGSSPKQTSVEASKRTTPVSKDSPKKAGASGRNSNEPEEDRRRDSPLELISGLTLTHLPKRPASAKAKIESNHDLTPIDSMDEMPEVTPPPLTSDDTPSTTAAAESSISSDPMVYPGALSHLTPGLGLSPTLTGVLWPFNADDPAHQDFMTYELTEGFQPLLVDEDVIDPALMNEDMDDADIEDVERQSELLHVHPDPPNSGPLLLPSPTAMSPPGDPFRLPSLGFHYVSPSFAPDSREMLTWRFDHHTCGILSIMDGFTENPWRSLIWPLAQQSPALYHAITAMTAFHAANDIPGFRVVGHEHKQASIHYIQEGIRDNSFSLQTAIATALALGFAEAWDTHTATGNTHIKGAQVLVKRALHDHQHNDPLQGDDLARLKFLCNAWVYMDVIARLTSVDSDESTDFDNTFIFSVDAKDQPELVLGANQPGFGIDFGMPIDSRLDPLMGCAGTLFPYIGRVANLVRKVCRSQVNSPAIISQANDLKSALETWEPPAYIERPEDPSTDVQHTLQTAEAYRWATLLHLHSSVPELPSLSSSELAQRVLQYLATVPLSSRTLIVQIYPLMVAGCEAVTHEDREWVEWRWNHMIARMRLGILEKALQVTREVWRRRDAYEARPAYNRKLVATAELNRSRRQMRAFQQGGATANAGAPPSGSTSPGDPGNIGRVFSYLEVEGGKASPEKEHPPMLKRNDGRPQREKPNGRDLGITARDPAYTVRGHCHWVGVMWDWGWEILLG